MGCGLVLGNAAPSVSSCLGSALLSTVRNLYFRLTLTLPFPQRPPKCPASRDASLATITCVEGASGARLFADPTASFKSAAFSQYVLYTYRQEKKKENVDAHDRIAFSLFILSLRWLVVLDSLINCADT